ncbi:DUF763 domain-containing protein [Bacteroidota bacterium]
MKRSGQADLPLHYGKVPPWLYDRMAVLGRAITESVVMEYGKSEFLRRMSEPFWFQSLGVVMGMDWHSSGITTSVMGALRKAINPMSNELGIYICGGRGKYSRQTPDELLKIGEKTGLDGHRYVHYSKLTAKIDNAAIQDGFQLYLHSFILSSDGEWSVIQQGMNDNTRMARRYHWHSKNIKSFVEEPHTSIIGKNQGLILNLTDKNAKSTRKGIIQVSKEFPEKIIKETTKLIMPVNHDVQVKDLDLKRLGAVLAIAYDRKFEQFEDLLMLKGLGPKTLRSLTLVSEVIHGTPSRFKDPARFSFAHGGKDGHPFPAQTWVYDETLLFLKNAIQQSKIGYYDKQRALKRIVSLITKLEKDFIPNQELFKRYIKKEKKESKYFGGRTVFDKSCKKGDKGQQLELF